MSSLFKNILLLLGIVATGALGFYVFSQNAQNNPDSHNANVSDNVAIQSAQFLRKLNELKTIELDDSLFSDPRFTTLVHFSQPTLAEPIGTANPFNLN